MPRSPFELLASAEPALERSRALPAECYRDPAFFAAEIEHVMRPEWHAVARSDELPDVGDYRSLELFGEPIVLVRDAQRALRAYSRVCLHRASILVTGEGNAQGFACPYHRWSYDLEGRLRGAPLMHDRQDFDPKRCRLPELALETWLGFVFVNLSPDPQPLAPRLEPLAKRLAAHDVGALRHAGTLDYDSPWNWKIMVENFAESYHHIGAHPSSLQPVYPAAGTYTEPLEGPFSLLENPHVEGAAPLWVAVVFPTTLFAVTRGDQPFTVWFELQIDRLDHFQLRIHLLLPASVADNPDYVSEMKKIVDAINQEDIRVCKGVQKGIGSRLYRPGPLSPLEEPCWRFHRYLAERLRGVEG